MTDTVRSASHENLPHDELRVIRNLTFDEISIGDSAAMERILSTEDIQLFAVMSGDVNPQHLDPEFAASTQFHGASAHGMWGAALISAVLGKRLPGPGTVIWPRPCVSRIRCGWATP